VINIALHEVHKNYGDKLVLNGVSFEISEGEKVGLLGRNGAGKTTLFRIISGSENCDRGVVTLSGGIVIGVLDQIPDYPDSYSGLDVLYTAFERLCRLKAEMDAAEKQLATEASPAILSRYGELQSAYEAMGGYTIDSNVAKVCNGLGIDKAMQAGTFNRLSGGEKTKINLGKLLLQDTNFLLLDEPTNHLDIIAVEWLEDYLRQCRSTVLVVSHDRYFLDRTVQRSIELENGRAELYEGGYSAYAREKEARFLQKLAQYEQEANKRKQLEEAAKRMHEWARQADNPKLHRRAFALEKRIERLGKTEKPVRAKVLSAGFSGGELSGKEVVALEDVGKAYGGRCVLRRISFAVRRGERIALIGSNGSGKTTLLRLLTGADKPDAGTVRMGESVRLAYLPQEITFAKPEANVLDTLRGELRSSEAAAREQLARYHFCGSDVFKSVGSLSGGEKSRLKLCLLMQAEVNFLILDEPTNHLDTAAREWIERALEGFAGTLLFVSHDRYFINRFATKIIELAAGEAAVYHGTYQEYRAWTAQRRQPCVETTGAGGRKPVSVQPRRNTVSEAANRVAELERRIMETEKKIENIDAAMAAAAFDFTRLSLLQDDKTRLTSEIEELYAAWITGHE